MFHTGGEMSPCNMNLRDQAQHAKTGIYAAGGMPHECPVVSVSDGLMGAPVPMEVVVSDGEATVELAYDTGIR